jgi:hypothetical protein
MGQLSARSFDAADEVRTFAKGRLETLTLGGTTVGRATFEPGWRWSECIKPVVGTESCQVDHVGYVASGRLGVAHEDGSTATLTAGDAYRIAPGHDAWVEGDEDFVGYEFKGAATYAKA